MEETIQKIKELIEAKRKRKLEEFWQGTMIDYVICEEAAKYIISQAKNNKNV